MKSLVIVGCTGSIGKSTYNYLMQNKGLFEVDTLIAAQNYKLLGKQINDLKPKNAVILNQKLLPLLKAEIQHQYTKLYAGQEDALFFCSQMGKLVLLASSGMVGLKYLQEAIKAKNNIALANKESIICGGAILLKEVKKHDITIIPIDSEHSSVFQCLQDKDNIEKIFITASGGPFLNKKNLNNITKEDALKHPNWQMGQKITIDSATLANKALEVIEAHYLFDLPPNKIEAYIHPQSLIHGGVFYKDGAVMISMAQPDMQTYISYALNYPQRGNFDYKKFNILDLNNISLITIDYAQFPMFKLGLEALKTSHEAIVAYNCANEQAVELFLQSKIKFTDIAVIVSTILDNLNIPKLTSIEDILALDKEIRTRVKYKI